MVHNKLLQDSAYGDRFAGGVFPHSALRTSDYHRWHSPVAGTVVEARIVQGQASLKVDVMELAGDADEEPQRALHAVKGTGSPFVQPRAHNVRHGCKVSPGRSNCVRHRSEN